MIKSLFMLTAALLATGVDAHETTASEERLRQLLSEDRCSYCDEQRAFDAAQVRQQMQINRRLRRIERRQKWDRMRDFQERANRR